MSPKSSILQILFILLVFCTSFLSAQLVLKYYSVNKFYTFVGSTGYHGKVTPKVLVDEAKKARNALNERLEQKEWSKERWPKERWPGALSALSTGDGKIYFASSIKGLGTVPGLAADALKLDNRVTEALRQCGENMGGPHGNEGKCGEIMVIAQWYYENKGRDFPKEGRLIVTVNKDGNIMAPCTGKVEKGRPFGCDHFLKIAGISFKPGEVIRPSTCLTARGYAGLAKRACRMPTKKSAPQGKQGPTTQKAPPMNSKQRQNPKQPPRTTKQPPTFNKQTPKRMPNKATKPPNKGQKH